jgi:hypothetical protein
MFAALGARPAPAQVASLEVEAPTGARWGTTFLVSEKGYAATSFTLLAGARWARIWLGDDKHVDIAGFVAASRLHDIVLLAGKDVHEHLQPLPLSVDAALQPDEPLSMFAGARSPPFREQFANPVLVNYLKNGPSDGDPARPWYSPRLYRRTEGAKLLAGWEGLDPRAPGPTPTGWCST